MESTTTIRLNAATYSRAKAQADERHITVDELVAMLVNTLSDDSETSDDALWDNAPSLGLFNPYEHTQEELDRRFDEIERELDEEEGITHEQLMVELKQKYAWLR